MPDHSPVKEIKISFHTIDGMTPKPTPEAKPLGAAPAGGGMEREPSPQTRLSPLEETLFKHWGTANGIQDLDAPDNHYDYRGVYQQTNGLVHPPGVISGAATSYNRIMQRPPIQPMPSHPQAPQLSAPGLGTVQQALAQKQGVLGQPNGAEPEPIRQLLNLLGR